MKFLTLDAIKEQCRLDKNDTTQDNELTRYGNAAERKIFSDTGYTYEDLLDRGEVDAAQEYLDRLKKNRSIHAMRVSSKHPVIDVILNQKYQTARENEIKMQIRVNDLSAITIPSDSLVVVLTNLLDNAIEACRRIDGYREILCTILYDDGVYISIRNTSEEVVIVDGKIPTSKQDSLSHGFGLMSVTYVFEELGAEYTFGYDEGWFYFAAEIE